MDDKDFQLLILNELKDIKSEMSGLKADLSEVKADISVLKTDMSEVKADISVLKTDMLEVKTKQDRLGNRQDEQHDMLTALLHNQEYANAKLESLEMTTANIETIQQMQQEVNVLGRKVYALAK